VVSEVDRRADCNEVVQIGWYVGVRKKRRRVYSSFQSEQRSAMASRGSRVTSGMMRAPKQGESYGHSFDVILWK